MFCSRHLLLRCAHSACAAEEARRTRWEPLIPARPQRAPDLLDPGHIQALAAALHRLDCAPMYAIQPAWTAEHHARDKAKAARILIALAIEGHHLTSTGGTP